MLIVGAGAAGEIIVKELLSHPQLGLNPIGFVDDDRSKHGHRLCDLPVHGSLGQIKDLVLTLRRGGGHHRDAAGNRRRWCGRW